LKRAGIFVFLLTTVIALLFYPDTYRTAQRVLQNTHAAIRLNNYLGEEEPLAPVDEDKTQIAFMFDDGWASVYSNAYPLFQKYGTKGSVAIIPSLTAESEYIDYSHLSELYRQGWDILNHSYSHKEDMHDQPEQLLIEFNRAREWMERNYLVKCADMAVIPYGECNPYLIKLLAENDYRNIRTSSNIITIRNKKTTYYPIRAISPSDKSSLDLIYEELLVAYDDKTDVLIILHKIEPVADEFLMIFFPESLDLLLQYIDNNKDKFQVVPYSSLFV